MRHDAQNRRVIVRSFRRSRAGVDPNSGVAPDIVEKSIWGAWAKPLKVIIARPVLRESVVVDNRHRASQQIERPSGRRIHGGFHAVAGPAGTITVELSSACKALGMRDRVRAGAQHPEQQQQRRTSTAGRIVKPSHDQAWCDAR
jgi:hypothetical protein